MGGPAAPQPEAPVRPAVPPAIPPSPASAPLTPPSTPPATGPPTAPRRPVAPPHAAAEATAAPDPGPGRLDAVRDRVFDLLVVGGGINGAGIARDAALRGLSVCLVEKEDWGWGTSAKSSMLIHGGLRYLEQFELGMVREALRERELLLRQAPHLVRPLPFLYPIYPDVAARRTVRVGLWLYDLLSWRKSLPKRRYLSREEALELAPGLEPHGLRGAATYHDAQVRSVERLVTELVWDARRHGAVCMNHTQVTRILVEADPAAPPGEARHRCTGAVVVRRGEGEAIVRAHAVVNASGPWVDDVLARLVAADRGGQVAEAPGAQGTQGADIAAAPGMTPPPRPLRGGDRLIRKTKGIHIVVPRFLHVALIVRARDGRTFFVLPWRGHCLVGTTDTDFEGDPGEARADADDVRYLVESARRYLPEAPLDDIRYTYAGVRPLVNEEGLTESNVTRRHVLYDHDRRDGVRGLWSVQGGKITTFRSLAEMATTRVCRVLGRSTEAKMRPTREGTLPGGPLVPWGEYRASAVAAAVQDFGVPLRSAEHLVDTYGARWRHVLAQSDADEDRKRIDNDHPHLWVEVLHAVREEDAQTLADVVLRRTDLGLATDGNPDVARRVAGRIAGWLGWDQAAMRDQLERFAQEVRVLAVP